MAGAPEIDQSSEGRNYRGTQESGRYLRNPRWAVVKAPDIQPGSPMFQFCGVLSRDGALPPNSLDTGDGTAETERERGLSEGRPLIVLILSRQQKLRPWLASS